VPCREHTSKALRYGMHAFSRDLTVLPAHPAFNRLNQGGLQLDWTSGHEVN